MKRAVGAAVLGAAMVSGGRARAEDTLRLTWFAPAGCPSTDDVKAAALRNVEPGAKPTGLLEAVAHVEQQTPSSWRVFLKTRRGVVVGEREIEAATCAGVADATAVVLALALVPAGTLASPVPPAEDTGSAAPSPAATASDTSTPVAPARNATTGPDRAVEPSSREPHALAAGVSVLGDLGSLPSAGFGGVIHVAWTPGRFRAEAIGRILGRQTRSVAGTGAGAELSVAGVGLRGCYAVVRIGGFDAAPCLGAGVDLTTAAGFGSDDDRTPTKAWTNAAFGGLARAEVTSWLALRARVEGIVPLYRPDFVVVGTGSVHQPPTVGAAASFGAEVLFL